MKKLKRIIIRVSEYHKNKIQMLADRYSEGNLSEWVLHACLNAPRKKTKKKNGQRFHRPSN